MYALLQHPDITAIEATGYPTRLAPRGLRCPVCGEECGWVYTTHNGDAVGCDVCVQKITVEEYVGDI